MTDYMKEAERLIHEHEQAIRQHESGEATGLTPSRTYSSLLAHIQRGAVPEGWKEATIAWEVCASIHREYAKKKDPFFTTRQADFVKHTEAARAAMLAAAPAPDQFRDAAKMMAKPAEVLGETCIDGGKCHHACADRCFRRECCAPLSGYSGPWAYTREEVPMTQAATDVLAERQRQISDEGWTPEHDAAHICGSIAAAAACYAAPAGNEREAILPYWPWNTSSWKPKSRRSDLVKAGALILAEIERLDRATLRREVKS